MGLFNLVDASNAFEDLLEREKAAVLEGRFDVLERLGAEKERLLRAVAKSGTAPNALKRLRDSSIRNGQLLDAMRAGVMAAQDRLKALRETKVPLQTYDASGRKSAIQARGNTLGRRA